MHELSFGSLLSALGKGGWGGRLKKKKKENEKKREFQLQKWHEGGEQDERDDAPQFPPPLHERDG